MQRRRPACDGPQEVAGADLKLRPSGLMRPEVRLDGSRYSNPRSRASASFRFSKPSSDEPSARSPSQRASTSKTAAISAAVNVTLVLALVDTAIDWPAGRPAESPLRRANNSPA